MKNQNAIPTILVSFIIIFVVSCMEPVDTIEYPSFQLFVDNQTDRTFSISIELPAMRYFTEETVFPDSISDPPEEVEIYSYDYFTDYENHTEEDWRIIEEINSAHVAGIETVDTIGLLAITVTDVDSEEPYYTARMKYPTVNVYEDSLTEETVAPNYTFRLILGNDLYLWLVIEPAI